MSGVGGAREFGDEEDFGDGEIRSVRPAPQSPRLPSLREQ